MPLVNVKLIEGVFTPTQKQEMIRKLTDTMVSIEGENLREATVVILEDAEAGDWAIGGRSLTTEAVKSSHVASSWIHEPAVNAPPPPKRVWHEKTEPFVGDVLTWPSPIGRWVGSTDPAVAADDVGEEEDDDGTLPRPAVPPAALEPDDDDVGAVEADEHAVTVTSTVPTKAKARR